MTTIIISNLYKLVNFISLYFMANVKKYSDDNHQRNIKFHGTPRAAFPTNFVPYKKMILDSA